MLFVGLPLIDERGILAEPAIEVIVIGAVVNGTMMAAGGCTASTPRSRCPLSESSALIRN